MARKNIAESDGAVGGDGMALALKFAITDQHYFRYSFDSSGTGPNARYTAEANADLDCDGTYSTFQLVGTGDPSATSAECNQVGTAAIFRDNETE